MKIGDPTPTSSGNVDYYSVKITIDGNGTVTPNGVYSGIVEVREWRDKTFTITPDAGFIVADVLVDGVSVGAVSQYTFKDVVENHTLSVVFKPTGDNTATPTNPTNHLNPTTGVCL